MAVNKKSDDLRIKIFDRDSLFSQKLQLESSVKITNKEEYDKIRMRIKKEFNIYSDKFLNFC